MSTAMPAHGLRTLTRVRFPRLTLRRILALAALVLVLFLAWLWVRSSSLVAIRKVQVLGLSGADVRQVRAALRDEALTMTTMDVSTAKLRSAVSGFPHIAAIRVQTHFPHAATITVTEDFPVATLASGGVSVAVDAAGRLLPRVATVGLPALPVAPPAGAHQVHSAGTRAVLAVLGAAPYQILGHLLSARSGAAHGVTVQLRDGPVLYFGDTTQLAAKWSAALATLANANSAGAGYIDVSAPQRPAAGILH